MASVAPENFSSSAGGAVFLSYAREDSDAARRLADVLRGFGVEAWFDQRELRGGDAWDQKIRRQIKDCALFIPIISAHTQARGEGYFRLEWKLAAERTHLMAEGVPFLAPVVIDDTPDSSAAVPTEFLRVQWTRLPGGAPTPEFVAQVKRLLAAPRSAAPAMRAPPVAANAAEDARVANWKWGTIVALVAGVGTALYVSLNPTSHAESPKPVAESKAASAPAASAPAAPAPAALDPKSVAVLAFANLSAEKDNEYFSDGLSENILDKLARVPGLRVMARTSSFSYKGKNVPVQQIASELHVGTVIEGSVMRAGNQLRITAQLINAADGTHVWSEQFDRELTATGIFAMQDEIALKIAGRLNPTNTSAVVAGERPTANLEAYDLYLRAHALIVRNLVDNREQVMKLLDTATRLDPTFALAWGWTGWVGARMFVTGGPGAELLIEPARRASDEALRLQPDLPVAHLARALFLYAEGSRLDEMAREIDLAEGGRAPTADTLSTRGLQLLGGGRFEAAEEVYRRAMELDSQNSLTINSHGLTLLYLGRFPEAMAAFDRAIKVGGSAVSASNQISVLIRLGGDAAKIKAIYESVPADRWTGQTRDLLSFNLSSVGLNSEALKVVQDAEPAEFLSQWSYFVRAASSARIREVSGDAEGARRDYREALPRAEVFRRNHPESWRIYVTLSRIYRGLGQNEEAVAAARKCLALVPPEKNPYFSPRGGLRVLVSALASSGQMDEALTIVREQAATGSWRRYELLLQPDFLEVRKDPRFREVAEKAPL